MGIDELEFRRILQQFPIVRTRDYCLDVESSGQSTSRSTGNKEVTKWQDGDQKDWNSHQIDHDAFWDKLKLLAEKKVGPTEAEKICKAFQLVYKRLVYEELSLEAAQRYINFLGNSKIYRVVSRKALDVGDYPAALPKGQTINVGKDDVSAVKKVGCCSA